MSYATTILERSIDPATQEMLDHAQKAGIETIWDRWMPCNRNAVSARPACAAGIAPWGRAVSARSRETALSWVPAGQAGT